MSLKTCRSARRFTETGLPKEDLVSQKYEIGISLMRSEKGILEKTKAVQREQSRMKTETCQFCVCGAMLDTTSCICRP